jgi:hypothetical protein
MKTHAALLAGALALAGCAHLDKRMEPSDIYNDPSHPLRGLPTGMLTAADCAPDQKRSPKDLGGGALPVAYQRFATAAYCAYVLDVNDYQGAYLARDKALSPGAVTSTSSTEDRKPGTDSAATDKVRTAPQAGTTSGATPAPTASPAATGAAAANQDKGESGVGGAQTIILGTSALSPSATLSAHHYNWLHAYMESGLELARENCASFFNHRERDRVNTSFALGVLNTSIAALTAALTHGGGHARSAFNLATTQTGLSALGAHFQSNYLFSPELGRLYEKLESEAFSKYREAIRRDFVEGKYVSFSQVTQDLQRYEDLCSRKSIARALAVAIELTRYSPAGSEVSAIDVQRAQLALSALPGGDKSPLRDIKIGEWRNRLPALIALSEEAVANRQKIVGAAFTDDAVESLRKTAQALGLEKSDSAIESTKYTLRRAAAFLAVDDEDRLILAKHTWQQIVAALTQTPSTAGADEKKASSNSSAEPSRDQPGSQPKPAAPNPKLLLDPSIVKRFERERTFGTASESTTTTRSFGVEGRPRKDIAPE